MSAQRRKGNADLILEAEARFLRQEIGERIYKAAKEKGIIKGKRGRPSFCAKCGKPTTADDSMRVATSGRYRRFCLACLGAPQS